MDLRTRYGSLRALQRDHYMVCWLHRLFGRPTHIRRVEGLPEVSASLSGVIESKTNDIAHISLIQTNKTFREIVISLAATYGLYLFGSIIHLEPWHMFTSFIQYMFLLPSCESCQILL